VPTAFVTHQLFIKTPFAQNVLEKTIGFFWKRYQEIWVPDFAGDINLSGTLSHRNPLPKTLESKVHYLGPLSRMDSGKKSKEVSKVNKIKVLAIISGPEPQRTLLEEKTLEQLKQCDGNHVVVGGRPESTQQKMVLKTQQNGTLTHYPHLPQQELESLIAQSEVVFCRSGYTTIMELYALQQKGVVFVPTPGQTEQEYLCEHFQSRKVGPYHSQKELNIPALLKEQAEGQYCGFSELQDKNRNSTQEQSTSLESFLANHPLLNTIAADVSGKKNTTS
jgi:predicted glycosyltransferase